jgi:hypothetical protein
MAKHSISVVPTAPKLNKDTVIVVAVHEKNSKLQVISHTTELGITAEHDLSKLGAKVGKDAVTRVPR